MTNVTTIETKAGKVTIKEELFKGYVNESFEYLQAIAHNQTLLKELVETVAETTGMKKGVVSKYLKQRFEDKTNETKDLGNLFEQLDEATA